MTQGLFGQNAPPPVAYCRVVVERGLDKPEGLTYGVPAELHDLRPGDRVKVPLGRGDRTAFGYVIEIQATCDIAPELVKRVLGRAARKSGEETQLPPSLVELGDWLASYYCCPLGMVMATMVPAAVKSSAGVRSELLVRPIAGEPLTPLKGVTLAHWQRIRAIPGNQFPMAAAELASRLAVRTTGPVRRLVKLGLLEQVERAKAGIDDAFMLREPAKRVELTPDQTVAVESLSNMLGSFGAALLFGVTGSGKTEVYLQVLDRVLSRGESAIVLVPEISLTPQTASRFVSRFQDAGISILHSGLTRAQRDAAWRQVRRGESRIVIGARSAVFAPFDSSVGSTNGRASASRLGIIIVDEEHDGSYKQDQLPRYHARDVAIRRAQIEKCPVILGSATPSLESWHNAQRGKYMLVRMPSRVGGGKLPRVQIVDLQEQRSQASSKADRLNTIGPILASALRQTIDRGKQAILLLNRRGYASYVCCPDAACGWFLTCNACDATMVYHRKNLPKEVAGVVRCHHCLAQQSLPPLCPRCGKRTCTLGFGTQRVEEELQRSFPELIEGETLLRLDSDSMNRAADYFNALERFRRGEVRVLLGTQMVAKGLDFPEVELIGVINADTSLGLPDFRAAERTFQLVAQVAGRAGRSADTASTALVIVQTINPDDPSIKLAAQHDYESFAQAELAFRRDAGLPPLHRMARIVCRDRDGSRAEARGLELAKALRAFDADRKGVAEPQVDQQLRIRGPFLCPISRIAEHHRYSVELIAPTPGLIQSALTHLRNKGLAKSDAHTAIDVDPISLL